MNYKLKWDDIMAVDNKKFCLFEKQNNLFSRTYLGIPYWQHLRLLVFKGCFSTEIELREEVTKKRSKISILKNATHLLYISLKSFFAMHRIGKHEVICFKGDLLHDRFHDFWTVPKTVDSVSVRINDNISIIKNDNPYNISSPYLFANISYCIKNFFCIFKRDKEEYEFIVNIVQKLKEEFGKSLTAEYIEQRILRYIEYRKTYLPYFEKLFKRVQCKAIIVVCYYQTSLMIAYEIAKQKGIRIIELEHGLINNQPEYWFEDQSGINNYTPDYFLVFGKFHLQFAKLLKNTRTITVGYPYQEAMIKKWDKITTEEKTIIIYPQVDPKFELMIEKFANQIKRDGYRIIMKLHPLESESYELNYPVLSKNKNIEIVVDQERGIYYWLKLGKHHVMAYTTVGFEALVFEHTNIYISTSTDHEQLQPLLDNNLAVGFESAEELISLIFAPHPKRSAVDCNMIWEKGGKKNIELFLGKMKKNEWKDILQ